MRPNGIFGISFNQLDPRLFLVDAWSPLSLKFSTNVCPYKVSLYFLWNVCKHPCLHVKVTVNAILFDILFSGHDGNLLINDAIYLLKNKLKCNS